MSSSSKLKKRLPWLLIFGGILLVVISMSPIWVGDLWYAWKQIRGQKYFLSNNEPESVFAKYLQSESVNDSVFARYLSTRPVRLNPVNTDFSIVIEKIGVNAPVVMDVSVTNSDAYNNALQSGVAHAATSQYPSAAPGNTYLFAHSSLNFWRLGKYATVFNLLRKLEAGDRIHIFFQQKEYVYETVNVEKIKGWDTYPIKRPTIEPILTLQTCDPPGTTLNRLVVTAKLIDIKDID